MNHKKELINDFLYELQLLSKSNTFDQKQVYLQLANYGIPKEEQLKMLDDYLSIILAKYHYSKNTEIQENKLMYLIKSKLKKESENQYNIKVYLPIKNTNLEKTIPQIIEFLNKKRIQYNIKISKMTKSNIMIVSMVNKKDIDLLSKYINTNKEIIENLYPNNPFYFNDDKISLSLNNPLTYNEVLSKYIYNYIKICNETNKQVEIEGLYNYIYTHIVDFISKNDLSRELKIIDDKTLKPEYLRYLEEITMIIYTNLKVIINNQNPKETFNELVDSQKKDNSLTEKYQEITKSSFEQDDKLLKEIIVEMTQIYGYKTAKQAIIGYKESGKTTNEKTELNIGGTGSNYITQTNNLRNRVENSKTFRTYINLFTDLELEQKLEKLRPKITVEQEENIKTTKEMILEDICKETYLACQTPERKYSGKNQVAISLIRMKYDNYGCITKNNNARLLAKEYIKPEEVEKLIQKTLEINGYIIEKEEDLYELYATHIEHLCEKQGIRKVR